jgi:hypothetical protein
MAGTGTKAKVKTGLGEARILVLGSQVLMGFAYRASFEPAFEELPQTSRVLVAVAMLMLVAAMACLIAPTPYHRIVAGGQATAGMHLYIKRMASVALAPFGLALGADVVVAMAQEFGAAAAAASGIAAAAMALLCWYGPAAIMKHGDGQEGEHVEIKDRIDQLMTEDRIVLPGVQALLGFQFASYLTKSFAALPQATQVVNTAALGCLVVAMVLLMMPAPYHRLAADGDATPRVERVAERLILGALPFVALGVAGDVYVVCSVVLGGTAAAAAAVLCAAGMMALWFGVPLYARRTAGETAVTPEAASRERQVATEQA